MDCPSCQHPKSFVINTRNSQSDGVYVPQYTVVRRRECLSCEHRFNTVEVLESRMSSMIVEALNEAEKGFIGQITKIRRRFL